MKEKSNYLTLIRPDLKTLFALFFGLSFIALSLQSCKTSKSSMMNSGDQHQNYEIYTLVDKMPSYPGGDEARMRFLQENIVYPVEARSKGYQGTVYLTFVVEPDGSITDVRVLKGVHPSIDNEAVRVIQIMPKWEPGTHRGKPLRVQFTMPIRFTLTGVNENN